MVALATIVDWYCGYCDHYCRLVLWLMRLLLLTDTVVALATGTTVTVTIVVDWYCG